MSQENVDFVLGAYARFNAGERVPELWFWHTDAEFQAAREDPDSATHTGIEAIRKQWARWLDAYPDLRVEARALDALSGGRLILGLGTGTRRMQRDWHGLEGEHPAPRMEELVPLVRKLLRLHEGPLEHEGRFYRTVVHPTAPVPPPPRADLPIYMGGVNARMIEAA